MISSTLYLEPLGMLWGAEEDRCGGVVPVYAEWLGGMGAPLVPARRGGV